MSLTSITTQLQQVSIGTNGGCTIITSETTTVTDDATGQVVSTESHTPTYAGKYNALQLFNSTTYQQLFLPAAVAAATADVPNNTNTAVGAIAGMDSNENSITTGQLLAEYDEEESMILERPIKKLRIDHTITLEDDGVDHDENCDENETEDDTAAGVVVGGTIKQTQLKRKKNRRLEEMMATTAAAAAASKKKKKKSSTKKSKNKKGTNNPAALTKKKTTASSSKTSNKADNNSDYYCEFKMAAPSEWLEYIKRKNQQNEYDKKAQDVNPTGYPSQERIYKFHQIRSRLFNIDETTEVVFEF